MNHLEGLTILVTGAGGFLGSAVVRALLAQRARVRALWGPPGSELAPPPEDVEYAFAEIDDMKAVRALVAGAAYVVHLAGPPSVLGSFDAPAEYARIHVTGTATLLEACLRAGVARVAYVSSAEVYGRPQANPVAEAHPLRARSPYGAAKIGAEQLVEGYYRALGGEAVILRPFSLYGPGQSALSLMGTILRQARGASTIELSDLRPERDYTFVDDVACAILLSLTAEAGKSGVFNLGTGQGTSVAELAARVVHALGREARIQEAPARRRPGEAEIFRLVADTSRARDELGWAASTSLAVGIETTIRWMKRARGES